MIKMCIFCDIINKKIPADIVYEDENLIAFLDIAPIHSGHTLIIPKKHSNNFINDNEFNSKALLLASKIANILKKEYEGINILMNTGSVAGQEVFHTHLHVIPRIKNDKSVIITKNKKTQLDTITNMLKDGLND